MPSQICGKFGHSAVSCRFRYGSPTVDDDLSKSFAGMRITHSYDPNWYPDTGATNHMTGDARSMTQKSEYVGNDQVMVGKGDSLPLPIANIGTLSPSDPRVLLHFLFRECYIFLPCIKIGSQLLNLRKIIL